MTIKRTNFTGPVAFSVIGLPRGVTGSFTPNPATATASTLTLIVSDIRKGSYPFTVSGNGGSPAGIKTVTASFTKLK